MSGSCGHDSKVRAASTKGAARPWLAVQPEIHYVRCPSSDRDSSSALVFGLRAEASFTLLGL